MANVTLDELKVSVGADPQVREELVQYHISNRTWAPGVTEYNKRLRIESELARPTLSDALVSTFLPQYNAAHQNWLSRKLPNIPVGNRTKRALGVGAATAATGLAAMVTSAFVDNEAGKEVLNLAAKTAFLLTPITMALSYASNFVNDTGKRRMKDVGKATGLSILAFFGSQAVDNETQKSLLEVGSYTGLAASAVGTLVNLVKYHR